MASSKKIDLLKVSAGENVEKFDAHLRGERGDGREELFPESFAASGKPQNVTSRLDEIRVVAEDEG